MMIREREMVRSSTTSSGEVCRSIHRHTSPAASKHQREKVACSCLEDLSPPLSLCIYQSPSSLSAVPSSPVETYTSLIQIRRCSTTTDYSLLALCTLPSFPKALEVPTWILDLSST
ncbi:hypothetical protein Mapa_007731 [Marchantia paleacea]|nr:hypothetical protein Mapa_007731 [Marchantia paleacea]